MTRTAYTLTEVSRVMREYINDDRPLNLREMRNFCDVIDSVAVPLKRLVGNVPDKAIPNWLAGEWRNVKSSVGR